MRKCTSWPRSGERNWGITDYLCEVVVNPISTSVARESIFLSQIICMTLHCRHGCCVRSGLASMRQTPVTPFAVGSWTFACELSEISAGDEGFLRCRRSGVSAGSWGCTSACSSLCPYSCWSSHITKYEVCHFLQYFLYLKYSNHRILKLSSSCTLELKRLPWRNSPTVAELMLTRAWGLLEIWVDEGLRNLAEFQNARVGWLGSIILSKW